MVTQLVFETHSWSEDNDRGVATGWRDGRLSKRGRVLAREIGERRRADGIIAVFTSDLGRAVETARIAFDSSSTPILHDWRLRECDYGEWNGFPAAQIHRDLRLRLDEPYPGGESWRQAVRRVGRFLMTSICAGMARGCSLSVMLLPAGHSTICSMASRLRI